MSTIATTVRLDRKIQGALKTLSQATKRPINKLVNEAVASYVFQRNQAVADELESMATALRAYRAADAHDEKAMADFVDAELKESDPLEGKAATRATRPKLRLNGKRKVAHA